MSVKIAIDAGHGIYTSGKRCMKAIDKNETHEWVLNSRVAGLVCQHLQRCGAQTLRLDDTTGETDVNLHTRCAKANSWGADWCCSIHHDSGINGGAGGGHTVYVYNGKHSSKSDVLQENVHQAFNQEVGKFGNRYDNTLPADFCMVRETAMPAILIECGFMDSTYDTPMILTYAFAAKAARGIAKGIAKTAGLTWKEESTTSDGKDEIEMTKQEVIALVRETVETMRKERQELGTSDWNTSYADIIAKGITDGQRPQDFCTREEAAVMIDRATK